MNNKTLDQWLNGIRISHISHHHAASHNTKMHKAFGIPVVIVTTAVGTTVFSSVGQHEQNVALTIVTGLLSIAAAILSTLQTFLGYSANAERHKISASKYGMLRRELELFIEDQDVSKEAFKDFTQSFRMRWDAVDQESLPIPERIHEKSLAQIKRIHEADELRKKNLEFN